MLGPGRRRQLGGGLEDANLSSRPPLSFGGVCGGSWMQNEMGVGKQGSLAEVGPWCPQIDIAVLRGAV